MKNSKLLEIDFAEFLGLDRVMTAIEIDELTEKLTDEISSRGIDSALAVKSEFIIEYLQDLLNDYGGKKYGDDKKIEMQFEIVRQLRNVLDGLKNETADLQELKKQVKKINENIVAINSPYPQPEFPQ